MSLNPNPPRLITVGIAIALLAVGTILAWPITPALDLIQPLEAFAADYGLALDTQTGWLALFLGNALLIAGSLLPGI